MTDHLEPPTDAAREIDRLLRRKSEAEAELADLRAREHSGELVDLETTVAQAVESARDRILRVLQEALAPDDAQLRIAHGGLPSGMGIPVTVGELRQALRDDLLPPGHVLSDLTADAPPPLGGPS